MSKAPPTFPTDPEFRQIPLNQMAKLIYKRKATNVRNNDSCIRGFLPLLTLNSMRYIQRINL